MTGARNAADSGMVAAWYDSDLPSERRRALVLWSSGELTYCRRDDPSDVWPAGESLGTGCGVQVAQRIADTLELERYLLRGDDNG